MEEKKLLKNSMIFATIKNELLSDTPTAYKDLEEEYQAYESYIVNNMLMSDTGILDADAIDKTDLVYKEWTEDETISLKEFLTYAIQQNWLDITKITSDTEYMDTDEMFTTLADYISTDRSAMMRELKKMRQEMLVTVSGRRITLR